MLTYETSISRVCSLIGNIQAEASGEVRGIKLPLWCLTNIRLFKGVYGMNDCVWKSFAFWLPRICEQAKSQEYCEMFTNWGYWCMMVSDSNYYIHIYDSWSSSRDLIFIHQLCHCFKNRRSAPFILLGAFTFGKW